MKTGVGERSGNKNLNWNQIWIGIKERMREHGIMNFAFINIYVKEVIHDISRNKSEIITLGDLKNLWFGASIY